MLPLLYIYMYVHNMCVYGHIHIFMHCNKFIACAQTCVDNSFLEHGHIFQTNEIQMFENQSDTECLTPDFERPISKVQRPIWGNHAFKHTQCLHTNHKQF